mmetsp:Transcript_101497/g.152054  ORF Transcript_101497/g.152054 Transcript_101497/m.152054 type:complete len:169 (+) Transcript_101497:1176-1682(+)
MISSAVRVAAARAGDRAPSAAMVSAAREFHESVDSVDSVDVSSSVAEMDRHGTLECVSCRACPFGSHLLGEWRWGDLRRGPCPLSDTAASSLERLLDESGALFLHDAPAGGPHFPSNAEASLERFRGDLRTELFTDDSGALAAASVETFLVTCGLWLVLRVYCAPSNP